MPTIWALDESKQVATPELSGEMPFSELMLKLFHSKGLESEEKIQQYSFPSLELLHDPFLMKGMRRAAARILSAIDRKELILVHGDYDVDGVTGAAIIGRMLERLNAQFSIFLPERERDGYGVSRHAIEQAGEKGAKLLITVDCGVQAFDQIKEARKLGIDVIVIDHHQILEGKLPDAFEILNPLQEDCTYPFKELSAGGLAFKLAQALLGRAAFELLELAALSTVCDLAPLVKENRVLVTFGLERMSERPHLGIKSLCEASKLFRKKISARDIGFVLGPRINASGRLGSPMQALQLLMTKSDEEAKSLAEKLNHENQLRQAEDRSVLERALQTVEREINFNRDRIIVVWGEDWHPGVIGIVAQRLVERFHRPAVVIAMNDSWGKGSARSVKGFHLFEGFSYCASLLEEFGGHELAAGLKIHKDQLNSFRSKLNEFAHQMPPVVFSRSIRVDLEISLSELIPQFFRELSLMEPFGMGNPRPVFLANALTTKGKVNRVSGALKWWLTDGSNVFEAIWRGDDADLSLIQEGTYSVVFSPKIVAPTSGERSSSLSGTEWANLGSVLLEVKDVKCVLS